MDTKKTNIKKIRIELFSDMCVSDGGIYNSAIDTDICFDSYGFPYIPGKRIRGCIRECAQELNDWGDDIPIGEMFGEKGNKRGKIIIGNAYLADRENYIECIRKLSDSSLCHPQNVLNMFSYIRTQTSVNYETGIAEEKSLRTMRVANKGLIFEADIDIHKDDVQLKESLRRCLDVFCHIGIARTRGYGQIKASLISEEAPEDSVKNNSNKIEDVCNGKCCFALEEAGEASVKLEYDIYIKEPIVCKSVNRQEEESLDYIEGTKILGLLGQMLKDDNKEDIFLQWLNQDSLYFSNAYISDGERRLYEVPASVFEIKNNDRDYRNKIYLENELANGGSKARTPICDNGLQLNQMKHRYVYIDETGNMQCSSVEMETRYHHSRPADKSIGRASEKADSDSRFYQISSIREGQRFKGFVKGPADIIKEIYQYICNNPFVSLGYGRTGEYGRCNIFVTDTDTNSEKQEKEVKDFYVLLKSPAIIYNDKAMYSTDVDDLLKEIFADIVTDTDLIDNSTITKYVNITQVGGYNVTWKQRKPTISAFDKGTVICVKLPKSTNIKLGESFIGERCMEGFGEIEVVEISTNGNYKGLINGTSYDKSNEKHIAVDVSKETFLQDIANRLFKEFLRYMASENIHKIFDFTKTDDLSERTDKKLRPVNESLKPTVSNMFIMCKENSSLNGVQMACDERFSKKSGNKDKKYKNAKLILNHIHNNDSGERIIFELLEEFQNIYNISGMGCEEKIDSWEIEYLKEMLIQIKYAVRKGEALDGKNK